MKDQVTTFKKKKVQNLMFEWIIRNKNNNMNLEKRYADFFFMQTLSQLLVVNEVQIHLKMPSLSSWKPNFLFP